MTKDREPTEAMVEAAWAESNRSSRLYSHSLKTGHNLKTSFAAGYRAAMVTASPPVDHGRVEKLEAALLKARPLVQLMCLDADPDVQDDARANLHEIEALTKKDTAA